MTKRIGILCLTILMILSSLLIFSSCGGGDGKEVSADYAFSEIEELDKNGESRRSKLLTKYASYEYLEIVASYYNETTGALEMVETIYMKAFAGDDKGALYFYRVVEDVTNGTTTYTLLMQDGVGQFYQYLSVEDAQGNVTKSPKEKKTPDFFKNRCEEVYKKYYNSEMLPSKATDIVSASKKSLSTDPNRIQSLIVIFNGTYNGNASRNEVTFNYETDKIHFIENYNANGSILLREVKYVYPGNIATKPQDVTTLMDVFDTESEANEHVHNWEIATYISDGTKHWIKCSGCTDTTNVGECSGGTATCSELAKCTVCKYGYGTKLPHTEEIIPAVEPTCKNTGFTEGKKCSICEEIIVPPTEVPVKEHTAGVCPDCGTFVASEEQTLIDAINNSTETVVTIELLNDIDFSTAVTIEKEVILNLNGKKLTVTKDTDGSGVFHVINGGKLTIEGDGFVNGVGNNNYNFALWADGGEIIINGGTFTNVGAGEDEHYDLIYVKNGGSVIINSGVFIAQTPKWTLNSHDSATGTIVVKGGIFYDYNPAESETEPGGIVSFVAEGYTVTSEVIEGVTVYTVIAAEVQE